MKKRFSIVILCILICTELGAYRWKGSWITPTNKIIEANCWISFRKDFRADTLPSSLEARIAADSRYWLWVNGQMVVREGGLKRGPNRSDTYFDKVEIAPYLRKGDNTIAVLMWHFGRNGFSHNSTGKAAMLFDAQSPCLEIVSDLSWQGDINPAFGNVDNPHSNFRLPEEDILYDASREWDGWISDKDFRMPKVSVTGYYGESPWNALVENPLPHWKDWGVHSYTSTCLHKGELYDTLVCTLPYDAQVHPIISYDDAPEGQLVTIKSDNWLHFSHNRTVLPVHAQYITKEGAQSFECYDWINGHKILYIIPSGSPVPEVSYRETGYDASFEGSFSCSDPFWNLHWKKAARTLYINMLDTYFDCPDRERAQWTGDAVNNCEEAFYILSRSADALGWKWLHEVCSWQKPTGQIYAPVPSGNWSKELCGQSLATVGYFGIWNYYMHSGDVSVLTDTYDAVEKYLHLWATREDGTVEYRHGEWEWGDWGKDIDQTVLTNALYYAAVRGHCEAARVLGKTDDVKRMEAYMEHFREGFNKRFWNGTAYRSEGYKGATDDRSQALAVVSGITPKERYEAILKVLLNERHASPYMERYVLQAFFEMGYGAEGLERAAERYRTMTDDTEYSTLFEAWDAAGGTVNHAWSGGAVISLARYLVGVTPEEPGYSRFRIEPHPCFINEATLTVPSIKGKIHARYKVKGRTLALEFTVPEGTSCITCIGGKERLWGPGSHTTKGCLTSSNH